MKKESFIYSTLTIGGSKEQVNEVMKYICDDIYDIGSIDLNKICAVPVHLNIGPDDEVSCGEKLYRHYLDLVPYPTEEEEENFLAVLSRADQRRFLLGKNGCAEPEGIRLSYLYRLVHGTLGYRRKRDIF